MMDMYRSSALGGSELHDGCTGTRDIGTDTATATLCGSGLSMSAGAGAVADAFTNPGTVKALYR